MNIGENIRLARKNANLTQKELGEFLGVSQAMIGQYEKGIRNPKIETLGKIAHALNVELYDLNENITAKEYNSYLDLIETDEDIEDYAIYGILEILKTIYGNIEEKTIINKKITYYLIGDPNNSFILTHDHLNKLLCYSKDLFPHLVNELKFDGTEEDYISNL